MTCEELQDSYEMHALGLLEDPERSELEEHLRRGCPVCTPAMQRAFAFNTSVAANLTDVAQPPARLRSRVVGLVKPQENRTREWLMAVGGILAACLVAVAYLAYDTRQVNSELAAARQQIARTNGELASAQEALSLLREAETKAVTFGKGISGKVFVNKSRGVLLIANNLPPAPAGKTYELWVIPKGGSPQPAGLFQSSQAGSAFYLSKATVTDLSAVAVSVEPEAGSQAPTTTPVLVVPVGD